MIHLLVYKPEDQQWAMIDFPDAGKAEESWNKHYLPDETVPDGKKPLGWSVADKTDLREAIAFFEEKAGEKVIVSLYNKLLNGDGNPIKKFGDKDDPVKMIWALLNPKKENEEEEEEDDVESDDADDEPEEDSEMETQEVEEEAPRRRKAKAEKEKPAKKAKAEEAEDEAEEAEDEEEEEDEKPAPKKKAKAKKTDDEDEEDEDDEKPVKAKKAKPAKAKKESSSLDPSAKIVLVHEENPRREGSGYHADYESYKKHKTVGKVLAAGTKESSIRRDLRKKIIKLG